MANLENAKYQTSERTAGRSLGSVMMRSISSIREITIASGESIRTIVSLVALAGLLHYCSRCGEWQGPGSEGKGDGRPNPKAAPIPPRLLKAISTPIIQTPTALEELPPRHKNKLTEVSGVLESSGTRKGHEAKVRHRPPSRSHGRRVEYLYEGYPKPDSYPHSHDIEFLRGDNEIFDVYERLKDGTIVYDNGVYEWVPRTPPALNHEEEN